MKSILSGFPNAEKWNEIKGFYKPTHEYETTFGPSSNLRVLLQCPCPHPPLPPASNSSLFSPFNAVPMGKARMGKIYAQATKWKFAYYFVPVCYNSFNASHIHKWGAVEFF